MIDLPELSAMEILQMIELQHMGNATLCSYQRGSKMPEKTATPTPGCMSQAEAECPKCHNTVYADHLMLLRFRIDARGMEKPTKLRIECPTCGGVKHVRLAI